MQKGKEDMNVARQQAQVPTWGDVQEQLRVLVGEHKFAVWLEKVAGRVEQAADGTFMLLLTPSNPFQSDWIQNELASHIEAVWCSMATNGTVIFTTPEPEKLPAVPEQLPNMPHPLNLTPHPNLFIALPSDIPLHDQQDLMERPFFSLSKNKRTKPIEYRAGENYIRVTAHEEDGMATIWDADILIWAASQITAAIEQGLPHSRFVRVVPYDLLKFIGRSTGGDHYERLKAAFNRLQTTSVATSIRQKIRKEYHRFSWISEWKEIIDDQKRTVAIEFILSDWFYEGVINQKLVLSIAQDYFDLTGGIERWLYRVVRKHGGKQSTGWAFTMRQLYEKSGSEMRFSNFAIYIRKIAKRQSIPEYWLTLYHTEDDEEALHFLRRSLLPLDHEGAVPIELKKRRTTPKLPVG